MPIDVLQWPERIRKCDEVIGALNQVRQTFVAAQLYEKQQKKDLLAVAPMVTRINTMLSGVSTTLLTAVEDVVSYLADTTQNNVAQWPFDWGPADQVFSTDPYGSHGITINITASATPGHFYISPDSAGTDTSTVDFFDAAAGWGVGSIFEVYNAEDSANNKQYKVAAIYPTYVDTTTVHRGILCVITGGWTAPTVVNARDVKIRFRLLIAI